MIERLSPAGAPVPKGPYSPAVKAGGFVFVAGQVPAEKGDIQQETRQVLNSLKTILDGSGASLAQVVKVSVFLSDGADFAKMNEVYSEYFGNDKPVRTTIVCKFMTDIRIEVDCIAYTG